ncbi:hypothetical protein EMPS_09010 [Entomortierella parvispora]|uniref:C2H2-type domain-containing protein n=1 Tax=Entomortierella parvispora TaxID=205924 RepID=A0A9P3HHF3_9FUNG|nr:hypothetical protein EMPS_09010 [Entomortierella parvispora]
MALPPEGDTRATLIPTGRKRQKMSEGASKDSSKDSCSKRGVERFSCDLYACPATFLSEARLANHKTNKHTDVVITLSDPDGDQRSASALAVMRRVQGRMVYMMRCTHCHEFLSSRTVFAGTHIQYDSEKRCKQFSKIPFLRDSSISTTEGTPSGHSGVDKNKEIGEADEHFEPDEGTGSCTRENSQCSCPNYTYCDFPEDAIHMLLMARLGFVSLGCTSADGTKFVMYIQHKDIHHMKSMINGTCAETPHHCAQISLVGLEDCIRTAIVSERDRALRA